KEKAPDTESGSPSDGRAKQGMAGTAGVGGQRQGCPKLMGVKNACWTIRADVAASGVSDREARDLRQQTRRTQSRTSRLVTAGEIRFDPRQQGPGSGRKPAKSHERSGESRDGLSTHTDN